jgi:flagellar hook-associated protein 2
MTNVDGLSSGLDTSSIINQLMQIERRPQVALTTRRDQETAARTELSGIRSDVTAIRNMAADLRLTTGWNRLTAKSSNEEAVSVVAGSAATTGAYSFQVSSVATAASVYSTGVYESLDAATGASGPSVFNSSGHGALGFSSVSGTGFADGAISFEVTQSSEAARLEGTGIPTIPITVDGTNDGIDFEVNGFSFSVTLTHDTYETEADIAAAVSAAIAADSGASNAVTASLGESNQIVLTTRAEGSANSVTLTGGTALADLGLTGGATATGVDGVVAVNGTATVITDTSDSDPVTLPSGGAGTITAVVSSGLRAGTATVTQSTSAGSGSLTDLVASLNAADLGYTANAVNTGSGYRLQLTANETGAASTIEPDPAVFGGMAFTVLSEGTDAELTIQGDNPLTITSSTNTFDELLPGVTVTVNAVTDTPVTVSTEQDIESVSESVNELVTKMNELFTRVKDATANVPGAARSVLQGNRDARRVVEQLRSALVQATEGNALTAVGVVGIELTRDGDLTFDQAKFAQSFTADQVELSNLFTSPDLADESLELGALDRLVEVAEGATAVGEGYLFTAGESADRRIEDYGEQIEAFERRLELRESTLRRTYANLEVALGGLQSQSSYLASQLSSLGGT